MTIKVGINGFGRMGRLSLRAAFDWDDVEFIQINDPAGNAATLAHLLTFDSVHGRWHHEATHEGETLLVNDQRIACSQNREIGETDWSGCDVVIEASGKMKTKALLQAYLDQGVKRVVVTAPVKEEGVLNVVMGVNHQLYDKASHPIVTAASCTTNCLAPVVKVIHEQLGIVHGSMTTIHDTNPFWNFQTKSDIAFFTGKSPLARVACFNDVFIKPYRHALPVFCKNDGCRVSRAAVTGIAYVLYADIAEVGR